MISLLFASLLSLAQSPPAITCANKDDAGNCVLDYSPKPIRRVHEIDAEKLANFYWGYFHCHSTMVLADGRFGAADGRNAIAMMLAATEACKNKREDADGLVDEYLIQRKSYGDAENRRNVREIFRQEAGMMFLYSMARTNGRAAEFLTTARAITEELVPSID